MVVSKQLRLISCNLEILGYSLYIGAQAQDSLAVEEHHYPYMETLSRLVQGGGTSRQGEWA